LPIGADDRWDTRCARPSSRRPADSRDAQYATAAPKSVWGEIPRGDHRYRIRYTVTGAIQFAGWGGADDLLSWNGLGHSWRYPVDQASVAVPLPISVAGETISAEACSGLRGTQDTPANPGIDLMRTEETPGRVTSSTI
jgi:hypothetical protein